MYFNLYESFHKIKIFLNNLCPIFFASFQEQNKAGRGMVDAVVSFVVQRIGDFLIQEASFLRGVRNEVQLLKNELEWMQCFIQNAEEKQDDDALIRKWVSDIRDIAYDTEDVLDKFLLEVDDSRTSNILQVYGTRTQKRRQGLLAFITKCSCTLFDAESGPYEKGKEKVNLYSIGKEVEALRNRINDLSRKRELYGLENIGSKKEGKSNSLGRLRQLRRAASFVVEEKVVGFDDDATRLLGKLLDKEPSRYVISILGMGGLGKTTLARRLYHNQDVKEKFRFRAWVYVSQDYNTQDLLIRIIKSFEFDIKGEELEKMNEEDLERFLYKSLQRCSYLVVADDVWHKEAWESLKRAFPDNMNGSRVIITTRIQEVAESSDGRTHSHKLRFLRPDESWDLFCEKAFRDLNADEEMEKLGREMVQKCGGLPLAMVVLAGLLSNKKAQEWHVVRDHIWRHLRNNSIHITYLLALSFNDLPYQLKLCFLYLGLFPEDFEINVEELIRLFVAEGFTLRVEAQTMEDEARDNLHELINRSLIQIEKRHRGRLATCRVHDLLRDLAIQKAKELNFVHIYDGVKQSATTSFLASCRRQAFYSWTENCSWLQHCNPLSRSLFFFNHQNNFCEVDNILTPLSTRLRLLRVLNLEGFTSWGLPEDIGKLIHLKFLGVSNALVEHLPKSIVNLRSLQTFYINNIEFLIELPSDIFKLKELRHVIGNFKGPLPIDNLTNLQTLKHVEYKNWLKVNSEKLVNLRELQMCSRSWTEEKVFTFDSIGKLSSLQILSVGIHRSCSFASLEPLSHCQYLVDLRLEGKIEKFPGDMHALLPNLQCLWLKVFDLKKDPMPALERLPMLMILDMYLDCYSGTKLICKANGFPRLEILEFGSNDDLEWQVEEGAFPMLRGLSLRILNSSHSKVPEKLRSIPLPEEWNNERSLWY
ncbi:Disease resistance protein [Melia azedarach]|uniref:Disease resistance protein n=1 Tax=Melia azedarach TaxID=155640 RepID=A0ACC1YME9_MELAZ|nr:Disease resistance protein [Melia azedarach]